METAEQTIPIDARLVALIETRNYIFKAGDAEYIKEMRGVYLYDKNSKTNCCEITPSYWLIRLYDEVILSDKGNDLSDEEKDRIFSDYENCPNDQDGIYVHCHVVDGIEERLKDQPFRYRAIGNPEVSFEDCSRDDQMEALREHYRCNHAL